jgi:ABC-type bacteriocin/lantibiotic exporter with double-glycine peptidase domain
MRSSDGIAKLSAEQDKSKWPDPGLAALVMLVRFHGLSADPEQIRHRFGRGTIGIPEMLRWAKELGLKARARLARLLGPLTGAETTLLCPSHHSIASSATFRVCPILPPRLKSNRRL